MPLLENLWPRRRASSAVGKGRTRPHVNRREKKGLVAAANPSERQRITRDIERRLAEDGARPIIFYDRRATCRLPQVKGFTAMVNSIFNGARMEDVWLDK